MADFVELLKRSTIAYKLSLILAFPVLLIFMIGFSTNHWIDVNVMSMGIWKSCYQLSRGYYSSSRCVSLVGTGNMPTKLIITQLVECLGLIALFTTLLCLAAQLLVPKLNKVVLIFGILAPLASGSLMLTGVCIFASIVRGEGLGYSFYLTILAGCGCIALFILGIINKIQSPPQSELSSGGDHQQAMSSAPAARNMKTQGYVISPPPQSSEIQAVAGHHPVHQQQQQQPQYPVEKDTSQFQ